MNTEHTPEPLFQYVYTTYILGGHCYFSNYHYCNLSFDESYVSFILLITFIRTIISIALLLLSSLSSLLLLIATVAIATVIAIVIAIVFASQFSPSSTQRNGRTTWACPTMSACRCGRAPSADHVATPSDRKSGHEKGERT